MKQLTHDREILIQCAIMKLIKRNKEMTIDELIQQTINAVKVFVSNAEVIYQIFVGYQRRNRNT